MNTNDITNAAETGGIVTGRTRSNNDPKEVIMVKDMATIAAECVRHPRRPSIWAPELDKYVCPDSREEAEGLEQATSEQKRQDDYRVE